MNWGRSVCMWVMGVGAALAGEPWSQFRGPNATGIAADKGYPREFGPGKNLIWRTAARGGKSSPVLSAKHVFVTAHEKGKLFTQCYDRGSGKLLWERSIERAREEFTHALNEPASSSPVTDDAGNVYVFFRDFGLLSYDAKGNLRWKTPLGPFANPEGASSSPIIVNGVLVLLSEQSYDGYIAGFDLRNGEVKWKTAREEQIGFTTPVVANGQIVAAGTGRLTSYDATNGKLQWASEGLPPILVATPTVGGSRVYSFGYGMEQPAPWTAIAAKYDLDKDGKIAKSEYAGNTVLFRVGMHFGNRDTVVTEPEWNEVMKLAAKPSGLVAVDVKDPAAPRELWRLNRSFSGVVPSPLYLNGLVYFVRNGGILTAIDGETGEQKKSGRLGEPDSYYASLVADPEGVIYATSEKGKMTAVRAGGEWEVIGTNDLGEDIHATPALSGRRIYVRTNAALYCFGVK